MAVRVFSNSTITLDEGILDATPNGALTVAAIFKRSGSTTDGTQFLLSLNASAGGNQRLGVSYSSGSALQITIGGISRTFGASFTISNNTWYCFVVTKAAGTATPRANLFNYGTSTWVGWTTSPGGAVDANADPIVQAYIGNAPGGFPLNGKIAVLGVWNSVLADADAETLETALQNWDDLGPAALWPLDQASTGTPVTDITGNGADQTAISGTSVDTSDDPPGFDFSLGGGATDLVVADADHAHTADQPTLTQSHAITGADAEHGHTADQPAVTQIHTLAADSCVHSHTAGQPTLTHVHHLAIADTSHAQTVNSPAITQVHQIAVSDAAHGHSVDSPAITQAHTLSGSDATHGHTADTAPITQTHAVAAAGARHPHAAGQATLTQAQSLSADDAAHAHFAEQGAVTTGSTLTPADAAHVHTVGSPAVAQQHLIAVARAAHAHLADQAAVVQLHQLVAADATHIQTADTASFGGGRRPGNLIPGVIRSALTPGATRPVLTAGAERG